jgi:hypothetical protein
MYALGAGGDREAREYAAQLEATRRAQLEAQDTAGYYGLLSQTLGKEPAGLIGMRGVQRDPASGHYGVVNDPTLMQTSNELSVNRDVADTRKVNADVIDTMHGAGYGIGLGTAEGWLRHPLQKEPDQVYGFDPEGLSPQERTERDKEEAAAVNNRITAERSGPDGGSGVKLKYIPGADRGVPGTFEYTGDPAAVAPYVREPQPNNAAPPPNTHLPPTQVIPDAPGVPLAQKKEMATRLGWKVTESGGYTIISKPGAEPAFYLPDGTRVKR